MKFVTLATASGEEHGCIGLLANSSTEGFKNMSPENKAKAEKMKKDDGTIVKAKYINYMGENERLDKAYCRWAGEPIQKWHLIPGYTYDMPRGFVEEVNNSGGLPQRSEKLDAKGNIMQKDGAPKKIHELIVVG